ncbi:unnamed protein product [Toxocara canis]|uniref:NtCtMGAM_N domain-containing protein n=1 Tax=Toxocara canis TaxID=6265 RepID=A0A183V2S5_TOXCA|nr:unnamed protein product [Toxocara canis]
MDEYPTFWIPNTNTSSSSSYTPKTTYTSSNVHVIYTDPNGGSAVVTRRMEDGRYDTRLVYSRDFMLAASASPYALFPPANIRKIAMNFMEIIAPSPTSFYNKIRVDRFT